MTRAVEGRTNAIDGERLLRIVGRVWFLLLGMSALLFLRALPDTWREASSVGQSFADGFLGSNHYNLPPSEASALVRIGLTPAWHAGFVVTRQTVLFGTAMALAWLVWRRSKGWPALFTSLFLATILHTTGSTGERLGASGAVGVAYTAAFALGVVCLLALPYIIPNGASMPLFLVMASIFPISLWLGTVWIGEQAFWEVSTWWSIATAGLGVVTLVARAMRGRHEGERKMLILTIIFVVAMFVVLAIGDSFETGVVERRDLVSLSIRLMLETAIQSLPILYGIGLVSLIARHSMWGFDEAFNRTTVYATLTTMLIGLYFVSVAVLQSITSATLAIRDDTFAVVIATAALAAIFLPLREGLQRTIDRLFFRKRYDLERTVEQFDLRPQSRERLDAIADDLSAAALDAFEPIHASLWIPKRDVRSTT